MIDISNCTFATNDSFAAAKRFVTHGMLDFSIFFFLSFNFLPHIDSSFFTGSDSFVGPSSKASCLSVFCTAARLKSAVMGITVMAPIATKKNMRIAEGVKFEEQVVLTSYVSKGLTPFATARKSKLTPMKRRAAELSAGIGYVISAACSRVMGMRGPTIKP